MGDKIIPYKLLNIEAMTIPTIPKLKYLISEIDNKIKITAPKILPYI